MRPSFRSFSIAAAVVVCIAVTVFLTRDTANKNAAPLVPSADAEMKMKQSVLEQDVQMTNELCRSQCHLHLSHTLQQLKDNPSASVKQILDQLHESYEHMEYLQWVDRLSPVQHEAGQLPQTQRPAIQAALAEGKAKLLDGQAYQSATIGDGTHQYVVIATPSPDGHTGIVGVIHQDILHQVAIDQQKNLRLVPYPSDKRFQIESVDPHTLRDVRVNHPEDNEGTSHYHRNQIVVKFQQDPSEAELAQIGQDIEARLIEKVGYTYIFESARMEAKDLIAYFKQRNVVYAEPHFLYMTNEAAEPNDKLFARYQWNLPAIETIPGWDVTRGSDDVIVAVVDTGVDSQHFDLKQRVMSGFHVMKPGQPPLDDVGHGTHVAGVIGAIVNNSEGVAGMTWFNRILPVKALDETGAGSTYTVAQGIIWATDQGAKVINMSLGNYADAQFLHDAIKYAFDRDVVLIAATGNDNTERPGYPAAYPEVLAVAATDLKQQKAPFSNFGSYVDVAAPGVNIASTYPNNQYAALSGTSMATPHVAALAALIRSTNPLLRNTEVMDVLRQTAVDLGEPGHDPHFGYGQIDAVRALTQVSQMRQSLTLWPQWLDRQLDEVALRHKGNRSA